MTIANTSPSAINQATRPQASQAAPAAEQGRQTQAPAPAPQNAYSDQDVRFLLSLFGAPLIVDLQENELLRNSARFLLESGQPSGLLEELWCVQVARLSWELRRAREITEQVLADFVPEEVEAALVGAVRADRRSSIAERWQAAEPAALALVQRAVERRWQDPTPIRRRAISENEELLIQMVSQALQRRSDEMGPLLQRSHFLDQIAEQAPELAERLRAAVPIIDAYLA